MIEPLFALGNLVALIGWVLLIALPRYRGVAQAAATVIIPGLLAIAYTALVLGWLSRAEGGFNALAEVRQLFQTPEILLAGWFHYLAFDLFVGASVARKCRADGLPHLAVVPLLVLTFLFGPIGYGVSLVGRVAWRIGNTRRLRRPTLKGREDTKSHPARWEPCLMAVAFLCLVAAAPTALAALLDGRTLAGAKVWLKPLKFELSVSLYLATLAVFVPYTSVSFRCSLAGRFVSRGTCLIGVLEIAYIAYRAARGEASHFNYSTPLAGILYGLMGIGALLLSGASLVLAWGLARGDALPTSPAYRLAMILGLVLSFVLGAVGGAIMSSGTSHTVGNPSLPDPSLPLVGWSRTVGDLRVPHFLGLHVLQVLPLVGFAAATWLRRGGRVLVVGVAAVYTVLTLVLFAQAVAGRPLLPEASTRSPEAGTKLVCIVYPTLRRVCVHESPNPVPILTERDERDGGSACLFPA